MDTERLISTLGKDTATVPPLRATLLRGLLAAAALAGIVFFAALGPRADLAAALETVRFLFKFVVTLALAIAAYGAVMALSRPGAPSSHRMLMLLAPVVLLALAGVAEAVSVPEAEWAARALGNNSLLCLTFIPLIGIAPLAVLLNALRAGAPTRPVLTGAVAGLLAGGVAATFYAVHCFDDSPFFVAVWYSLAVAILALAGAAAGRIVLRW
ncbi:NrsF family protein [Corticibacterium sp. UT-5YL-CI-8]|nr:NrsF family protein [Tianweitania sp. UT-5YL-CI-8]